MNTLFELMPSVGVLEISFAVLASLVVIVLLKLRSAQVRWWIAGLVSVWLAALLTPADPLSTLVFGVVLFGMYCFGARVGSMKKNSPAN